MDPPGSTRPSPRMKHTDPQSAPTWAPATDSKWVVLIMIMVMVLIMIMVIIIDIVDIDSQ